MNAINKRKSLLNPFSEHFTHRLIVIVRFVPFCPIKYVYIYLEDLIEFYNIQNCFNLLISW